MGDLDRILISFSTFPSPGCCGILGNEQQKGALFLSFKLCICIDVYMCVYEYIFHVFLNVFLPIRSSPLQRWVKFLSSLLKFSFTYLREIFSTHSLIHCPNACNSRSQARMKLGAWNSIQFSMWVAKTSPYNPAASQGMQEQEAGTGADLGLEARYSDTGGRCLVGF